MFIINLEYSKLYFEREISTKVAFSFDNEHTEKCVATISELYSHQLYLYNDRFVPTKPLNSRLL